MNFLFPGKMRGVKMIHLEIDNKCQHCEEFVPEMLTKNATIYADFEEQMKVTDFCITCAHRKVCAFLNSKCEQTVNDYADLRDNVGQFHGINPADH